VIVNHHGVCKSILHSPVQDFRRKRIELVQRAATKPAVREVAFATHPSVIFTIADDIDLFDLVHPDIGDKHRSVGVPRKPMGIAKSVSVDLTQRVRAALRGKLVRHRNRVIAQPLPPVRHRWTSRIDAQNSGDD
jgi:hypothetical protein